MLIIPAAAIEDLWKVWMEKTLRPTLFALKWHYIRSKFVLTPNDSNTRSEGKFLANFFSSLMFCKPFATPLENSCDVSSEKKHLWKLLSQFHATHSASLCCFCPSLTISKLFKPDFQANSMHVTRKHSITSKQFSFLSIRKRSVQNDWFWLSFSFR